MIVASRPRTGSESQECQGNDATLSYGETTKGNALIAHRRI